MIKKIAFLFVILQFTACSEFQNIAGVLLEEGALTNTEIGNGLKQALELGIGKGADRLSMTDGYLKSAYKILLPKEVTKVENTLRDIGAGGLVDKFVENLNRGAEDAAKKAKPIFVGAIKQMTFDDAMNILMGDKNSATNYLNTATRTQLYSEFNPVINKSLNKFDVSKHWKNMVNAYNRIPLIKKVELNSDLGDYVTNEALNGLFGMVEKEELNIRTNVSARSTDLLKKVFAKQD